MILPVYSKLLLPQNHGDICIVSMSHATMKLPDIVMAMAKKQNNIPVGSNLNNGTIGFVRIVNIGENSSIDNVFSPIKWLIVFILSGIRLYTESEMQITRYVMVIPFNVYLYKSSGLMHSNMNGMTANTEGRKKEVNFIPLCFTAAPARKYIAFSIAMMCSTSDNSQKLTPSTTSKDTVFIFSFNLFTA